MSAGGTTSPADAQASGWTEAPTKLRRSGKMLEPPEPGALRPLARALVDVALALERQDEENE